MLKLKTGCSIYCGVDEIELHALRRQNVGTKFQGLVFMEQILAPLVTFVGLDLLGPPGPICNPPTNARHAYFIGRDPTDWRLNSPRNITMPLF